MLPKPNDCTEGGITQSGDGALAHCGALQMAPGRPDTAVIAPPQPDPDLWLELDGHMTITACHFHPHLAQETGQNALQGSRIMEALNAEFSRIAPQIRAGLRWGVPAHGQIMSITIAATQRRYLATILHAEGGIQGANSGYRAKLQEITGAERYPAARDDGCAAAQDAPSHLSVSVDALPDACAVFDPKQQLVVCNAALRGVFPDLADILVPGQPLVNILHCALQRRNSPSSERARKAWVTRKLYQFSVQHTQPRLRKLHSRWYREAQYPTADGGRVIILSDVTAWKDAETHRLAARMRALDACRDGVLVVSTAGRVQHANPSAIGIFQGETADTLWGRDWCDLLLPCHPNAARDLVRETLAQAGFWRGQSFFTTKTKETVEIESSVTQNTDGSILCIFRDITAQRLNEIERERLREQLTLARRREEIAQIAAGLAHDFNNILAGIAAAANIISEADEFATAQPLALRISDACDQAGGLLRRMLSLGKSDTPHEVLDLRRPLRDAESLLRPSLCAPVALYVDLPPTPLVTYADSTAIVQMVLNLVINARDAILAQPEIRAEAGIRVALGKASAADLAQSFDIGTIDQRLSYARITVADDGPGLSDEVRARMFTPYFSTKGADGTGLGLAIVVSVIQKQGGALALYSGPDGGTRFTILWPLEGAGEDLTALTPGLWAGEAALVLSDDPDLPHDLAGVLQEAGALVQRCGSWDEICAYAQEPDMWDCVVLDRPPVAQCGAQACLPKTLPVLIVGNGGADAVQTGWMSQQVAYCIGPPDRPDFLTELLDIKHKLALAAMMAEG
jgi:signal transduction histidine kinase